MVICQNLWNAPICRIFRTQGPDRLARFGLRLIQQICNFFQIEIVCTHTTETIPSLESQLTHDVIATLTSFAGKLHRFRRGQQNLT